MWIEVAIREAILVALLIVTPPDPPTLQPGHAQQGQAMPEKGSHR